MGTSGDRLPDGDDDKDDNEDDDRDHHHDATEIYAGAEIDVGSGCPTQGGIAGSGEGSGDDAKRQHMFSDG